MKPDRRHRLEALPDWSWNAFSDAWQEGFSFLKEFADRESHCRVTSTHKTGDGYRLGQWVSIQRRNRDKIEADRRHRLEALPGWVWKVER